MHKKKNNYSWLIGSNKCYLENLYKQFLLNPKSINNSWCPFFEKISKEKTEDSIFLSKNTSINNELPLKLIHIFRVLGYKHSYLDPLNLSYQKKIPTLKECLTNLHSNQFKMFFSIKLSTQIFENINLETLHALLKNIYCKKIGYEYMHIQNVEEKEWIQNYIETKFKKTVFKKSEQITIFRSLIASETLEKYFSFKFPGAKRFSIEGSESLIPMLNEIIHYTKKFKLYKIIFGMSHRGRLNVLANIMEKPIKTIFKEFSESNLDYSKSGDVKYHQGFSIDKKMTSRVINLDLKYNPSHLEIINSVVIGSSRAYIDSNNNFNYENILPIIIHGDAAISGQGVVQEILNMSQVRGYKVGGTIHIIINNQIGFTTSNPVDLRTSENCTDIAKMIDSPIFHVNSDDPESVLYVIRLALDYRFYFNKDVFINLVCYRRHGHNEIDDPKITQPLMYSKIEKHPTVINIYNKKLISHKIIDEEYLNFYKNEYKKKLDIEFNFYEKELLNEQVQECLIKKKNDISFETTIVNNISYQDLTNLAKKIYTIPNNIIVHKKVSKIYQDRLKMINNFKLFDWGSAELLAYASLLNCGISCRISGEDVCRGTFSHRHAVIYDQISNISYIPLQHINSQQGKFYIWDSVLSEESILAFEYGYSIDQKNALIIWEAQFGDFANGAQIVIDQFICSGEQKWGIKSNLVMFLPHGYEGQGPEHSSARIERFLQLSAENNIYTIIPTTASQIYHVLRKQAFSIVKKPLIVITPKSLLRHPLASSSLLELVNNKFKEVIDEIDISNLKNIKKIIFCSGKIYYELLIQRRINQQDNVAIIRIEQLYPFPIKELSNILKRYMMLYINNYIWCQEEPKNQGAWLYIQHHLKKVLSKKFKLNYVGRSESASPATGYIKIHKLQQKKIIDDALTILD